MGPMGPKAPKGPMGPRLRNGVGVREQTRNGHNVMTYCCSFIVQGSCRNIVVWPLLALYIRTPKKEHKKWPNGWRHKLSNTLVFWGLTIGSTKKTFLPRNKPRKMISGWYSVYPAPNGVARLFRFDGKFRVCEHLLIVRIYLFYWSKTTCPWTSLDNGQLFNPIVVTENGFW